MKNALKYILHKLLGFQNYLFAFSLFKIYTLKWDKKEKDFFIFLDLIDDDSVVLDIGANIGIMTTLMAKRYKHISIFSFEPMPNNIRAFKRVITFFNLKNVKLFEFAVGNSEGRIDMVMPVINSVKMQGLSHVLHDSILENNSGEIVRVSSKMLDNMSELLESEKKISAIKIDIENFEFYALEGAKKLLAKHRPIVYAELWENTNRENSFNLMTSLGYKINVVKHGQLTELKKGENKTQNFIFTHPNT